MDQDLRLKTRSVLTDQALALKEDRRRTNSLESTGKMPPGQGRRDRDKRQHPELTYKNGEVVVRDPTGFQIEQECLKRHNQVMDGKKKNWAKKEAEYKAQIVKLQETEAQLRTVIEDLNRKKRAAASSGGGSKKKPKPAMNDAVMGRVDTICKSQLWRVCKFISDDDQVIIACEIVMSFIDNYKQQVINADGTPVDEALKSSAVGDFVEIYGAFIVTTINSYRSTTQSQFKTAMKQWFMSMEPEDYPTPEQYLKAVLRIGLGFDKDKPSANDFERSILLFHADQTCPKCGGQEYWTKHQRMEGLMSFIGPKDQHVDSYVTPSTESIAYIYFKNLRSKVIYEVECDKANPLAKPGTSHDKKSDRWATKWSDAKIGQSVYGGWSPEALTEFATITRAVTESRKRKTTKKADGWLLKAIRQRHKYVEKGEKKKKVKISPQKPDAPKAVIVPFDGEVEAETGGVDLSALGIDGNEIDSDDGDSDDFDDGSESESEVDPVSGSNPPQEPNQGSDPPQAGNPGSVPPQPPPAGASAAAS